MKIALLAVDSGYPNLALMKIAAYHKANGDTVEWYNPFDSYQQLYMSKIFSFTPDYGYVISNVSGSIFRGGTGYDLTTRLHPNIDCMQPDYGIYPSIDRRTSYGFLTRGCPNRCKWCVVPRKEGDIHPYMDIDDITLFGERPNAVLMDNNILASDYGLGQIEKIVDRGYRVDFNQALDARLVTPDIARLLARVKWVKRIRFGCDTPGQIAECEKAIDLIRSAGYRGEFLLYCIILDDFHESYHRIRHWRDDKRIIPFAQPYRDPDNPYQRIPQWQLDLARWTDEKAVFRTVDFHDYRPRKGFRCIEYFNNP